MSEHFQLYLTLERRLLLIQGHYPDYRANPCFIEEHILSEELEHLWYELSDEEREEVVKNHHKRIGKFCEESNDNSSP